MTESDRHKIVILYKQSDSQRVINQQLANHNTSILKKKWQQVLLLTLNPGRIIQTLFFALCAVFPSVLMDKSLHVFSFFFEKRKEMKAASRLLHTTLVLCQASIITQTNVGFFFFPPLPPL